jgi:copper chaperone
MSELHVQVGGMTCGHCDIAIERAIAAITGVEAVHADHVSGRVDVTFSSAEPDEPSVREAIEEEGYDVVTVEATA